MVMIGLYLAPLAITSPCIMEENQLPPKPALVGHRGAPMVSDQHWQHPGVVVRVDGAVPGHGVQRLETLVAAGLDELWPAWCRGIPTAARAAQDWRMGERWVRRVGAAATGQSCLLSAAGPGAGDSWQKAWLGSRD